MLLTTISYEAMQASYQHPGRQKKIFKNSAALFLKATKRGVM